MDTIPMRLDWFLGYDLDSKVPDHSVLSKARVRWGVEAFRDFFEGIVWQCVEAGLVDRSKILVDSSLVDANASNNSVIDTQSLKIHICENYKNLKARLEGAEEGRDSFRRYGKQNSRYMSTTDPDAAIVNRGKPKLRYQVQCLSSVVNQVKGTIPRVIRSVSDRIKGLVVTEMNRFISRGFVSAIYTKADIYDLRSLNQGFEQQPVKG
jgi:hypothetical protein